jgi:kinesin family protein C1
MLEIYNETIRDLLVKGPVNGDTKQMYVVKHDSNGNTSVSDLTLVEVTTWKEVSSLLHRASQSRYCVNSCGHLSHFLFHQ